MGRHRYMVFLIGGGGNGIDAGRKGALLVFGHQRRRRHLRDHETGIETGLRRQESGQARQHRIDQHGDTALGDGADLAQRHGDHVGGEGDRLGMEIAARDHFVFGGEDQRIVRDRIGFDGQRRRRLAQQIETGAHHLRLAAQAIWILHARIAEAMRGANGAAVHQAAQSLGDLGLAAVARTA